MKKNLGRAWARLQRILPSPVEWLMILAIVAALMLVFGILFTAFAYAFTPFGEPKFWWEY